MDLERRIRLLTKLAAYTYAGGTGKKIDAGSVESYNVGTRRKSRKPSYSASTPPKSKYKFKSLENDPRLDKAIKGMFPNADKDMGASPKGSPSPKTPPPASAPKSDNLKKILNYFKDVGGKAVNADDVAKSIRSALGKGVLLGGGALATAAMAKRAPKKTLIQELIGKDTVGRKALMFGAGGAALAGGIKGVEGMQELIAEPLKKKKYFNKMMDENPGLKKERPGDVSKIFRTLYKFNPVMASDPLVAGSFLKRSLQFKDEGIQPIDIKTLTEVSKHLSDSKRKDSLLRGAFAGTGAELLSYAG